MVLSGGSGSGLPSVSGQSGKVLSNDGSLAGWQSVGGDVTGAITATAVGRIQGRNISASAPSAGQALVWNASVSQWEPGTISGGGGGGSLPAYTPARSSNTVLTLPSITANTFRFGTMVCAADIPSSTITIGAGTGTLWIGLAPDCTVSVRHNVVATCSTNCSALGGVSGFDPAAYPLHEWTVTSGVLASTGLARLTPYSALPLMAGSNISFAVSGGVTTISATGGGSGGSSYPPLAVTSTYEHEEFLAGGDCFINTSNLAKLGWRAASTIGGETLVCGTATELDRPGTVTVGTGTVSGNEAALWTPLGSFHSGGTFTARFLFRLPVTTNVQAIVGLGNAVWQSSGGLTGGVYFEKESADANWFATTESASSRTRVDTGVAVGSGWMVAQIRRIDASTIGFKIAATMAALATASEISITTNVPAVNVLPSFQVRNTTTAARVLDVDFYDIHITGLSR